MSTRVFFPSPRYLSKLYASVALVFVLFILPWVLLGLAPGLGWIYVGIFLAANVVWMVPTFALLPAYYKSISYEIGENALIVRKGIITRSVKTIPYRTITDLILKRDPLDRWFFETGTLEVQTAGKSGQTGPEASLVGLSNWDEMHTQIMARLRAYQVSSGVGTEVEPSTLPASSHALLRQILDEIRGLRQDLRENLR